MEKQKQKLSDEEAGIYTDTKPGSGDKQWTYTDNWIYLIRQISIAKVEGQDLRYKRGVEALISLLYKKEKKEVMKHQFRDYEDIFNFIIDMLEDKGYLGSKTTVLRGSG